MDTSKLSQKRQRVLVAFIQDRSGSMADQWNETVNGFRVFRDDLLSKDTGADYCMTLTVFDSVVEDVYRETLLCDVDPEILNNYPPRYSTALYDAAGQTITNLDRVSSEFDSIICVIVTDGIENSSREWTKDRLHSVIDEHLKSGKWTFTYLGTQPESWDAGLSIGVSAGNVGVHSNHTRRAVYRATSSAVRGMSLAGVSSSEDLYELAETPVLSQTDLKFADSGDEDVK